MQQKLNLYEVKVELKLRFSKKATKIWQKFHVFWLRQHDYLAAVIS